MTKQAGTPSLNPRKAPRQRRSEATVEIILTAAARILDVGGITALSTNAVAEIAGVSIGSLYQYFPNKNALIAALIREHNNALVSQLARAVKASGGLRLEQRVAAMVDVALEHQLGRPRLAVILDLEERKLSLDEESAAAALQIRNSIAAVLREGLDDGFQPDLDTHSLDILAIARGMIDTAAQDPSTNRANLKSRVVSAVLGYLQCNHPQIDTSSLAF